MRFNRQAEFNRRPFNATAHTTTLPAVDIPTVYLTAALTADVFLPSTLRTGFEVSRDLSMPLWTAKTTYTKAATGGVASTIWFSNVELIIPDHLGVDRCVFAGIYPAQTAVITPGADSETFVAYDNFWYLTENPLQDHQLSLLKPADQDLSVYKRLDYDYLVNNFTTGRMIIGETSEATALIVAVQGEWLEGRLCPASSIFLRNIVGTFQDDETITEIAGPGEALVNGALTSLDFSPSIVYPEDWLEELLGGSNWDKVTGIYPYRLNPVNPVVAGSWTPMPDVNWPFTSDMKASEAIAKMDDYYQFVSLIKFKRITGYSRYVPCYYHVHQDDIDNPDDYALTEHRGLSLPAAVTVTATDKYLRGPITLDINGASKKNKVRVRCQGTDGTFYENVQVPDIPATPAGTATCSAGVYYGEERPLVYLETNPELFTQAQAQLRAALLYQYVNQKITTYKATFSKRSDFEIYQILTLSGHSATHVPDGNYRIIGIRPRKYPGDVAVDVTLIPVAQLAAQIKINRIYSNSRLEMQRIIDRERAKQPMPELGTITAVSGDETTLRNEEGITKVTRTMT